ncbi:MAG: hypothetical protein IH627_02210 [Rubrivivax sp.]|nr:hypothetical protein [Rubrivivax sp.]
MTEIVSSRCGCHRQHTLHGRHPPPWMATEAAEIELYERHRSFVSYGFCIACKTEGVA